MHHPLSADDTMAEVLQKRPAAARILVAHRMHCVGCAIAPFETLAEACAAYGLPTEHILADLEGEPDASEDMEEP